MTEIKPNEVHAATAELTSDATLRLVRNGVAQEGVDKLMLWRQHHVLGAEEGIRAGGKDLDLVALGREGNLCAAGTADPIALHGLDLVRPIQ